MWSFDPYDFALSASKNTWQCLTFLCWARKQTNCDDILLHLTLVCAWHLENASTVLYFTTVPSLMSKRALVPMTCSWHVFNPYGMYLIPFARIICLLCSAHTWTWATVCFSLPRRTPAGRQRVHFQAHIWGRERSIDDTKPSTTKAKQPTLSTKKEQQSLDEIFT